MLYLTRFTALIVRLSELIEQQQISPEHIRVWLRLLGVSAEATPDPMDRDDLDILEETVVGFFSDFLILVLSQHIPTDNDELTREERATLTNFGIAVDRFIQASVARQKRGEEGWVHTTVNFMEAGSEDRITPYTLEALLRATAPTTTVIPTFDA